MSGTNGNGGKPLSDSTALDDVERRIAAQQSSELVLETIHVGFDTEPVPSMEEESSSTEDPDPLSSWKRHAAGKPVTLDQIHSGLIAAVEYSKAAIESTIQMTADLRDAVDVRTQQINGLAVKVESTSQFLHKLDEETGKVAKVLDVVRRDVQYIKDDVREIKVSSSEAARQLPAIKDMLGEILARLPDPGIPRK